MIVSSQTRAVASYRKRLRKQGVARFEVLASDTDRDLIRSLAKRLSQNDPEASRIRAEVTRAIATEAIKTGGILAALRRSPLVGTDLEIMRSKETGRTVEL